MKGGVEVRERVAFVVLVAVLILLFALTFAVLGKGHYEPSHEGSAPALQASSSVPGQVA
jgi:hypothetical protein